MPKQIHTIVAAMFFAVIYLQTPTVDAQNLHSRQPLQLGFRWLGQGWSAGYHHQTPGPNSDYYNPYTAHNSMLISKMPGYQTGHGQYGQRSGFPSSSYSNHASGSSWDQGHAAQTIQPTFVPVDDDDESAEDDDFMAEELPEAASDSASSDSTQMDDDDDSFQDADFDESSFDNDDPFDDFEDMPDAGSTTKEPGSTSKESGSGTKATKTGFSTPDPGSFEAMDIDSFMVN